MSKIWKQNFIILPHNIALNTSVNNVQTAYLSTRPAIHFFGVLKKKTVNTFSLYIYIYLFGILNFVSWSLILHLCKHKSYLHDSSFHPCVNEMFALLGCDEAMQCWLVVISQHWITSQKSEGLTKLLLLVLVLYE